jgi:hypothetical protein
MSLALIQIPHPNCCADLTPEESKIGVTIQHPSGDGSLHELDLYWAYANGRRGVVREQVAPLTLAGEQACPCGWRGTVLDGTVVTANVE